MSNSLSVLTRAGLINQSAPDYSDIVEFSKPKKVTKAFCASAKCCKFPASRGTLKNITNQSIEFCPDCGDALVWARVKKT